MSHKLQFFLFFVKWDSSFFFLMNQMGFKLQAFTSCYYFLPSCITSRAFFGSKLSRGLRYFFWSSFFIEIRICYGPITWAKPTSISFFFLATIRNTVDAFKCLLSFWPQKNPWSRKNVFCPLTKKNGCVQCEVPRVQHCRLMPLLLDLLSDIMLNLIIIIQEH